MLWNKKTEENKKTKSSISARQIMMVFLFLVGLLAGGAIEHFLVEPHLNSELTTILSECRTSLNLVNQEVEQCYLDLESAKNQSTIVKALPDKKLCERRDYGWQCTLTADSNQHELTLEQQQLEAQFREACVAQGGRWKCYGFCMPWYQRNCEFPYPDKQKSCTDSNQCLGGCVPVDNTCQKNCRGKCSEYPLTCFALYTELIDGKPHMSGAPCD